jgi:hypothetical protein
MNLQPGAGYGFTSSGYGISIDSSNPFPDDTARPSTPFYVIVLGVVSGGLRYQVVSGTLNNLVPEMDDVVSSTEMLLDHTTAGVPTPPTGVLSISSSTKESWVYLRAGADTAPPYDFPDANITNVAYPKVISSDLELSDTDTEGYVLLAKVSVDNASSPTTWTVFRYVSNSLWGDRIKLGTNTARYYYARI